MLWESARGRADVAREAGVSGARQGRLAGGAMRTRQAARRSNSIWDQSDVRGRVKPDQNKGRGSVPGQNGADAKNAVEEQAGFAQVKGGVWPRKPC